MKHKQIVSINISKLSASASATVRNYLLSSEMYPIVFRNKYNDKIKAK